MAYGIPPEMLDEHLYLGGYTNTIYDIETRIGKSWGELLSLSKVWDSPIRCSTKIRLFEASVKSILLYGEDS